MDAFVPIVSGLVVIATAVLGYLTTRRSGRLKTIDTHIRLLKDRVEFLEKDREELKKNIKRALTRLSTCLDNKSQLERERSDLLSELRDKDRQIDRLKDKEK